jgi:hypothetical protein
MRSSAGDADMTMPAMGKARIALGVGFVLIVIAFLGAARDHWNGSEGACADKSVTGIPKTANMVYIEQKEIFLNSAVCIAVRGERYFKAERTEIDAAIVAVVAAEKDVAQAETQKLPEVRTKLETARKALATAEAALATKSAAKAVYLFIDEVRTPSSMDVYTSDSKDVKDNKDGWTWKTLNIARQTTPVRQKESCGGRSWAARHSREAAMSRSLSAIRRARCRAPTRSLSKK